jgi:methylmalonyl-CoA mutase N-terminal domain/subunit
LARRAWEELIWVEGLGGLATALASGALANRLERSWSEQAARFASGEEEITGVTAFRSPEEAEAVAPAASVIAPEDSRSARLDAGAVVALPTAQDPGTWLDEAAGALRSGASLAEIAATLPGTGEGPTVTPLPRHRDAAACEEQA